MMRARMVPGGIGLALALSLLGAVAAAPLFAADELLARAWWAIAGAGALVVLAEVALFLQARRRDAAAPVPPSTRDASAIDFDRPWKGGAP